MLTFLSIVWMRPLLYSDGELRQEIFREYGTRIQAHTAAVRDGVATRPLLIALTPLVDVEITVVPFAAVPDVSRGTPAPTPLSRERYRLHRDFQWEIYVAVLLSMAFIISLVYNASELFAAGRRTTHIVTAPLRQPG
ncbi:MAG TPA: hypothetical protein VK358_04660, partial [Longimicrobium sp.]|nr:hypothetical protein [Longimicrobium sp.]